MYKHLLIAFDGSAFSLEAATHGLDLAKALGAKVTAMTVTPTWQAIGLSEIATGHFESEFAARSKAMGEQCLSKLRPHAAARGLEATYVQVMSDKPYQAINDTAAAKGADLVVVGSHGRRGIEGVLALGSETVKLLTSSHVPVLVYRR